MSAQLQNFLRRERGRRGITSVCSASHWVLEAAMQQMLEYDDLLLIEATSNQVNQHGGYTGMRPADFVRFVYAIAARVCFPVDRLLLGGDHLGPNAWQHLTASEAMPLAEEMMRGYAAAGFRKIHLDASMRCANDPAVLPDHVMAQRAAVLCTATEEAAQAAGIKDISYVVGTEVPVPGGADHSLETLAITSQEAVEKTLAVHREMFLKAGLADAWSRVIGVVVQPGVEFDHNSVIDYIPEKAHHLKGFLAAHPEIVMEAHSTDYQRPRAFIQLVRDGFAILKVGPALTFAQREAFFALEEIEKWLVPSSQRSLMRATLEGVMLANPKYWQKYYVGTPAQQACLRVYSYSDRLRYYWGEPSVEACVNTLLQNLEKTGIPETLLSQHMPQAYLKMRANEVPPNPRALVLEHIGSALQPYMAAARGITLFG